MEKHAEDTKKVEKKDEDGKIEIPGAEPCTNTSTDPPAASQS